MPKHATRHSLFPYVEWVSCVPDPWELWVGFTEYLRRGTSAIARELELDAFEVIELYVAKSPQLLNRRTTYTVRSSNKEYSILLTQVYRSKDLTKASSKGRFAFHRKKGATKAWTHWTKGYRTDSTQWRKEGGHCWFSWWFSKSIWWKTGGKSETDATKSDR